MGIKVVNGDKLWKKVQREDAARRRRDRKALAEGRITPGALLKQNSWFSGPVELLDTGKADQALVRCLRRSRRSR